jgi:hypothetical protein
MTQVTRLVPLVLLLGCQAPTPVHEATTASAGPPAAGAASDAAPATPIPDALGADVTVLHPLAMQGPYKTLLASCKAVPPCGSTDFDVAGMTADPSKPGPPNCDVFADSQYVDENAMDAKLSHKTADGELRIGSAGCPVPKGLRYSQRIYFAFVKRADGWWRSAPLFTYNYNDKYCGGSMVVRWNEQTGRTFAGIAATLGCLACNKNGNQESTVELMVRFEPGTTSPIVFPPLPVGERDTVKPDDALDPQIDCKASKMAVEMKESWSSDDDLVLTGPATWAQIASDNSLMEIDLGERNKPSTAGKYHFAR